MSKKYPCPAGREDDCGYPACAHDRQCELAASDCSADKLPKEQDEMARDIARFLWEHSAIRHGMFTPPEFIPMASSIIREYFKQQNSSGQQP